jgi:hypothetical protein
MNNILSLVFSITLVANSCNHIYYKFSDLIGVGISKNHKPKIKQVEEIKRTKKPRSKETLAYFNEIALKSEWGGDRDDVYKWKTDLKIFVEGKPSAELKSELYKIVRELNEIIIPIELTIVKRRQNANMFVYFGSSEQFADKHPSVNSDRLEHNWGYFKAGNNEGFMYVDINRANQLEQKHLLREELTQSLGLFNDSYKYPESIFYQKWTTTTEYAPIDKELIDMLYNE